MVVVKLIKTMLLTTTTGREFELDNSSATYLKSRYIISELLNNGVYDKLEGDEEVYEDVISSFISLNHYEEGRVRIVCRHYFHILRGLLEDEKIDRIDFLTLIGKLTMEELSGLVK